MVKVKESRHCALTFVAKYQTIHYTLPRVKNMECFTNFNYLFSQFILFHTFSYLFFQFVLFQKKVCWFFSINQNAKNTKRKGNNQIDTSKKKWYVWISDASVVSPSQLNFYASTRGPLSISPEAFLRSLCHLFLIFPFLFSSFSFFFAFHWIDLKYVVK